MTAYQDRRPPFGARRKTECCGDPTNLDGGAHPWIFVGEDDHGMHYRCPECGAVDSD